MDDSERTAVLQDLADEVRRLGDRLRTLSLASLAAPVGPGRSRADAARETTQRLADLAAASEQGPRREVPRLPDAVVADQLRVCATEVVELVRGDLQRAPLAVEALDALRGLRSML